MRKFGFAFAALALSVCTAGLASAQAPAQVAGALGAVASTQYGNDRDWRPGPGWNRDIEVRCASSGYNYQMCRIDTGRGSEVRIVRQISNAACVEGRSWGWNRAGIWVDQGCEAVFRVRRRWGGGDHDRGPDHGPGGWQPGPGFNTAIRVRCESQGFDYRMCQVDTGRGSRVRLERQISKTRCIEGRTWGFNRAGVWVTQGCAGVFLVDRRWR